MSMILEIAANSVTSALIAQFAGADRIEFFSSLQEGGITPSYGQMKLIQDRIKIPVYVMLRPRGGDFLYSEIEFEEMLNDLALIRQMGFAGVVFGLLTPEGDLDITKNKTLVELAKPMSCTLHRAFDRARDPMKALEDAIECGFERILTSGQQPTAEKGRDLIRQLVEAAGDRIAIMPGSGITPDNARELLLYTGAKEIHSTARIDKGSGMTHQNPAMAEDLTYSHYITSPDNVKALSEIKHALK